MIRVAQSHFSSTFGAVHITDHFSLKQTWPQRKTLWFYTVMLYWICLHASNKLDENCKSTIPLQSTVTSVAANVLWESVIWSNFLLEQNNFQSSQWVGGRISHKPTCTNAPRAKERELWDISTYAACLEEKNRKFFERGRDFDDRYWLNRLNAQRARCKFTYRLQSLILYD